MEAPEKENSKNDFLKACEKFIKEHPSKNITGECENCFLLYIQSKLDFKVFTENNYNYTDCYKAIKSSLTLAKVISANKI